MRNELHSFGKWLLCLTKQQNKVGNKGRTFLYPCGHSPRRKPCNVVFEVDATNANNIHLVSRIIQSSINNNNNNKSTNNSCFFKISLILLLKSCYFWRKQTINYSRCKFLLVLKKMSRDKYLSNVI